MSSAQHLYQPLSSLPEDSPVPLPVGQAGPGVCPEHDGGPQVRRPEQGQRGEAEDGLEKAVEEEEEEEGVKMVHLLSVSTISERSPCVSVGRQRVVVCKGSVPPTN